MASRQTVAPTGSVGSIAAIVSVIRIGQMVILPIGLRLRIGTASAATVSVTTAAARHIGPRPIAKRTPARARPGPIVSSTAVAVAQADRAAPRVKLEDSRVRTRAHA